MIEIAVRSFGLAWKYSHSQVTCLFWFENGMTLKQIEHLSPHSLSYPHLCADSIPNIGFRKWVATLLSTTQVTQNVIILALYFIWKLKSFNPTVKGRPGSEYRLLTVALMLGNKCEFFVLKFRFRLALMFSSPG